MAATGSNTENDIDYHKLIKKFVTQVSRPIETSDRIQLIQKILNEMKNVQLEKIEYFYLWKGFFFSIWYTEMGKGCEEIITLVSKNCSLPILFAGFELIHKEWFSIDYIRVDKFMLLARTMLNQIISLQLKCFVKTIKDKNRKGKPNANFYRTLLKQINGVGLQDHIFDITLTETFKILSKYMQKSSIVSKFLETILEPMLTYLANDSDDRIRQLIPTEIESLFDHLKRYRSILSQTIEFCLNCIEKLTNDSSSKSKKALLRLSDTLKKQMKLTQKLPELEPKQQYSYNRRKALKNKAKRLKQKRADIIKKSIGKGPRQVNEQIYGDSLGSLIDSL